MKSYSIRFFALLFDQPREEDLQSKVTAVIAAMRQHGFVVDGYTVKQFKRNEDEDE